MTEQMMAADGALPISFSHVTVAGQVYVDAVHATSTKLDHRDRPGCRRATGTGGIRAMPTRIEERKSRPARGKPATYGRPIAVRLNEAEVPLPCRFNVRRHLPRRSG